MQDARQLSLDIEKLRDALQKPLRPSWITPATDLTAETIVDDENSSWPVVLCTASSCDSVEYRSDTTYVQGAADDHESWAQGLTAVTFWQNEQRLLHTPEDDLSDEIHRIVQAAKQQVLSQPRTLIRPTTALFISSNASALSESSNVDVIVYCSATRDHELETGLVRARKACIHLACGEGKNGSRQLRNELSKLDVLAKTIGDTTSILCACPTGQDLAVGAALAILCKHFADNGGLAVTSSVNKAIIKQKLSWIMVSMPDAAPSRATLQSVNAFLMS